MKMEVVNRETIIQEYVAIPSSNKVDYICEKL
jgi:hypothetical protein